MQKALSWFNILGLSLALYGASLQAATGGLDEVAYTVIGARGQAQVRVLTHDAVCPVLRWEGGKVRRMTLRAPAETVAARAIGGQAERKASVFDIRTCEATWPEGASAAWLGKTKIPAPPKRIDRIVIVADTGCRLKASEGAYQNCNDLHQWPFAQVARSAALTRPDLVVHIGDLHYRESPCAKDRAGCEGSPWGYGYDAWQADFFAPAQPLLQAAPWVFVRGNHESCLRAGQGWFRFMDANRWSTERSCNSPVHDAQADHSEPYAVALDASTQMIVFDSARASGKAMLGADPDYAKYLAELKDVDRLASRAPNNLFLSHHPLLAYAPVKANGQIKAGGSLGLQSVFAVRHPLRLFPEGIKLAFHGHVHLFEALSFSSDHPGTFILGNSGSANEGHAPESASKEVAVYPGAMPEAYTGRSAFGFATLERHQLENELPGQRWVLTEFTPEGQARVRCQIFQGKSSCTSLD